MKRTSLRSWCLVGLLALSVCLAWSAHADASPATRPHSQGSGPDIEVIDVTTPKGKLMSETARNKLLRDWISWGYRIAMGPLKNSAGRYVMILKRTASERGVFKNPSGGGVYWPYRFAQVGPNTWDGCWINTETGKPAVEIPLRKGDVDWCSIGGYR